MATRMHAEIEKFTPVLEKISNGSSLDYNETQILEEMTEDTLKKIFDWIQTEKKDNPSSTLIAAEGLYYKFVSLYQGAQEKNDKLKKTYTSVVQDQLKNLGKQVVVPDTKPSSGQTPSVTPEATKEDEKQAELKIRDHLESQRKSVRALISEMTPENLQKGIDFVREYSQLNWIPTIPGLEKMRLEQILKHEPMVRGVVGGMLYSDLQNLGYQIIFVSDTKVKVQSQKSDAGSVEVKLNQNLSTSPTLAGALQAGMLYANNPGFRSYQQSVVDNSGKLIDPKNTTIQQYTEFLRKKPHGELTDSEKAIISSAKYFTGMNFPATIEGFSQVAPFFAAGAKLNDSPAAREAVQAAVDPANGGNNPEDNSFAAITGRGVGSAAGAAGKFVGVGVMGGVNFLGTMMKEAGTLGSIGIIAALGWSIFSKKGLGFWGTLGAIFGLGIATNLDQLPQIFKDAMPTDKKPKPKPETPPASTVAAAAVAGDSGARPAPAPVSVDSAESQAQNITDTPSLRRVLLGLKKDENIDSLVAILSPIAKVNFASLATALEDPTNSPKWESALKSLGFNNLSPEEQKQITDIIGDAQKQKKLHEYVIAITGHSSIVALKKSNPDKYIVMTLHEMENYIIDESKKKPQGSNQPLTVAASPSQAVAESQESSVWVPMMTWRDGNIYIIGQDGRQKPFDYNTLSPEAKKAFEVFKENQEKFGRYLLLIQALGEKAKNVTPILEKVMKGTLDPANFFAEANPVLTQALGKDATKVMGYLESANDADRMKLYYYIKDDLDGFAIVSDMLAEKLVDQTSLSDKFQKLQAGNFTDTAIRGLGLSKDREKDMLEKRSEFYRIQGEMRNRFAQAVNNDSAKLEAMIKAHEEESMLIALRYNLVYDAVDKGTSKGTPEEIALFDDIEGISITSIKDSRAGWYRLAVETVAIEIAAIALGMTGIGLGAGLALKVANMARIARLTGNIGKISMGAARIIGGGAGFNIGYNGVIGYHEDGMSGIVDRLSDKSGWLTSIGFVGATKLLGVLHKTIGLAPKAGEKILSVPSVTRLTIDGTALGLAGGALNVYVDGGEWSHEALIQGFMLAIAARAMGNISKTLLTKNAKQQPTLATAPATAPVAPNAPVPSPAPRPANPTTSAQAPATPNAPRPTAQNGMQQTAHQAPASAPHQTPTAVPTSGAGLRGFWSSLGNVHPLEKLKVGANFAGGNLNKITGRQFYSDIIDSMILKDGLLATGKRVGKMVQETVKVQNLLTGIPAQTALMTFADVASGKDITAEELAANFAMAVSFGGARKFVAEELFDMITNYELKVPFADYWDLVKYISNQYSN